jgi:hypothetical protein
MTLPKNRFSLKTDSSSIRRHIFQKLIEAGVPCYQDTTAEIDPDYPLLVWDGEELSENRFPYYHHSDPEDFLRQFGLEMDLIPTITITVEEYESLKADRLLLNSMQKSLQTLN